MRHHPGVSHLCSSVDPTAMPPRFTVFVYQDVFRRGFPESQHARTGSGRRARAAQVGRRRAAGCRVMGWASVPGRGAQTIRLPPEQPCCMAGDGQGQKFGGDIPVQHSSGGSQNAVLICH